MSTSQSLVLVFASGEGNGGPPGMLGQQRDLEHQRLTECHKAYHSHEFPHGQAAGIAGKLRHHSLHVGPSSQQVAWEDQLAVCVQRHATLVWAHCYCFSHLLAIFFWDFSRRKKMETNVFPAHGWTAAAPPQPLGSDNAPRNPVQFISVRLAINKVCVAFQGQGLPDSPSILSEGQTLVIKWRS